jgi:hypothetical protein
MWRSEMKEKELNVGNARHAFEYLQLINDAETPAAQEALLKKWGSTLPLNMLLILNFDQTVKLELPEGQPPFKRDEETHPDLMTPLAGQIGRLKACRSPSQIRTMDRERVFIQVLEQIPAKDADVLCAAKDRSLTEMYPKITADLVKKVFPAYVK